MDFTDYSLEKSTIDFFVKREFVDPDLIHYWKTSCKNDESSAGCQYFLKRFEDNTEEINPYSVYAYCYYNDSFNSSLGERKTFTSQQSCLRKSISRMRGENTTSKYNGAPCCYFDGMFNYFNLHATEYHAKWPGMTWNGPCVICLLFRLKMSPTTTTSLSPDQ